ncbi:MAG: DUF2783 domain-containing protein [Pseudomonadota bacterium]
MPLITEPHFADPDAVYARLREAHEGLNPDESAALDVRLVLILANHVGDADVLNEAIALARRSLELRRSDEGRR